ncbi:MAG: hypothetical protein AAF412_09620 [Pseudomonadota bacterium]
MKRGVGRPKVDTDAVNVRMHRDKIQEIDDWRRAQMDMPTRPEAVRRLVDKGLNADQSGNE